MVNIFLMVFLIIVVLFSTILKHWSQFIYAIWLLGDKRYEKSNLVLDTIISSKPQWKRPYFQKQRNLRLMEDVDGMKVCVDEMAKLFPNDPSVLNFYGQYYTLERNFEAAKKYLDTALRLADYHGIYFSYAFLQFEMKEYQEALEKINQALSRKHRLEYITFRRVIITELKENLKDPEIEIGGELNINFPIILKKHSAMQLITLFPYGFVLTLPVMFFINYLLYEIFQNFPFPYAQTPLVYLGIPILNTWLISFFFYDTKIFIDKFGKVMYTKNISIDNIQSVDELYNFQVKKNQEVWEVDLERTRAKLDVIEFHIKYKGRSSTYRISKDHIIWEVIP
ncbi:MAG: hypothetical protein INQ03_15220 [Candidatus Heimdallarchaeota archaeon]|nr:hypothetical protein [Candidatus Heimdallarchaeota archaeon]